MNKERRTQLDQAIKLIGEAKSIIEVVQEAEQEAYDNLPEGIQNGERGEQMTQTIEHLIEAIEGMGTVEDELNEAHG